MRTEPIYGNLPADLGRIDLSPVEMMAWLYLPIRTPNSQHFVVPPNLRQFRPIIDAAWEDSWHEGKYIYITAKTLWVDQSHPHNRPGWHSDGFLSDDLNYVWSDRSPTIFWDAPRLIDFEADHVVSMREMHAVAEPMKQHHTRYPDKHLLRLNQTVIHKVDADMEPGMRSFVKISVSRHKYCLAGNSINHDLPLDCKYVQRSQERNCPITEISE